MRVEGVYEDAVAAAAAAEAVPGAATLADVAYDDADPVAHWVADGYSTIFAEAAEQADVPFDVVLCQIGVGSFASAAVRFACHQQPRAIAIGVEPANAACVTASLAAGRPVVVDTPGTSMAGLNCATPSHAAWPVLRDGLAGTVVIGDDESHAAMRDLAARSIVAGDCGAASLAGLRALLRDPECAELASRAGLGPSSCVLIVSTEGATDPGSYARTTGARMTGLDASRLAERFASPAAEPAAGPALCATGALAAALIEKACALSPGAGLEAEHERATDLRSELLATAERDYAAFQAILLGAPRRRRRA